MDVWLWFWIFPRIYPIRGLLIHSCGHGEAACQALRPPRVVSVSAPTRRAAPTVLRKTEHSVLSPFGLRSRRVTIAKLSPAAAAEEEGRSRHLSGPSRNTALV